VAGVIGGRQLRHGGNSAVLILAVLGILVAVNYLAYRRPLKKDLTTNQRFSLSDQTRKAVGGLREDVRILHFQRAADLAGGDALLRQYEALSPHVKAEFVDPYEKPARALEYDVRGALPVIVVERRGRRERVASPSEQDLTNAIINAGKDGRKTVCFASGEGERDVDDGGDAGYTGAKEALTGSHYATREVVLARESAVPADCRVLVVAGPQSDLLAPVAESIRAFVAGGGKALVMAEPPLKAARPNLDGLLAGWGLEAGKDVVVDYSGMGQLFGTGALTPIATEYPYHEITKNFGLMTAFHEARSVQPAAAPVPGIAAQAIVQTSAASWAETDLTLKAPVQPDGADRKGPISLGAVATIPVAGAPSPSPSPSASPSAEGEGEPEPPRPEGRVAAFGDADFASNAFLSFPGNRDFFLNVVAWLAEDADLISIRPREPDDQRLFLTQTQQQTVALVALLLIPGLFVALGVWMWWTRR
jgi:ABC-type uncharacterized transport system involved in gliding motility auxiliary subunit